MARLLDTAAGDVTFGYYYTLSFEEVVNYVRILLEGGDSFLCTVHSSALFVDAAGEEQELHMPALEPVLFDPDEPVQVFDDKIQNIWDEVTNPDNYSNIEGSGWTILPGTNTFWVNTIRYQPNNNAHPSERNCFSPHRDDPDDIDDPAYSSDVSHSLKDTFLLSLAAHFVPRKRHHTRLLYTKLCETWIQKQGLAPGSDAGKITPTSLGEWHEKVYKYNIRVFSDHGNVIYHWHPPADNEDPIDLLWKNNKFSYITNLWALLKEKSDRHFCDICKKFHSQTELCKRTIKAARSTNISVPEHPTCQHHFVIYADFESYIRNGEHRPSGYSYLALSGSTIFENKIINYLQTDNVAEHFVKSIIECCKKYTSTSSPLENELCGFCGKPADNSCLVQKSYISGVYCRYHKDCWDDHRNTAMIFFHNFRGYDSHYILKEVMKHCQVETLRGKSFEKFDLIACSSGPYVKFTFKDTFNFLSASLAKLVKSVNTFVYTPVLFRNSKGVFPYDWFDNPEKLRHVRLPAAKWWFNKLTNEKVDPTYAYHIWNVCSMKTFADYHDTYMRVDVLQLADVFEEFRHTVFLEFGLDPVYCQGSPSLTWQLCLEQNHSEIKVIKDISVYLDIQKNIRGGISQVMTRYCNTETKGGSILYLDINSLYSACMEEPLPSLYVGEIKELPSDWEKFADPNHEYTALFCVDLTYPPHLHDSHRFYPLAPHKFNNRLCATFEDKNFYLCHARNLKYYLDNGLVMVKFHYGYVFNQSTMLKSYVKSNIEKRKVASANKDNVRVALYKLLNNSLYGKTCENKFKYRKYAVKDPFVGIWGKQNPFMFRSRNWLEVDNKILCEEDSTSVRLDKPIQIGFSVLELAKLKIYQFVYPLRRYFPEVELLYTDTDSVMMWFPYKEPELKLTDSRLAPKFDFENSPEWFRCKTVATDKVSGLWSLETDKPIVEFVGLRAKTYAIRYSDNTTTLKNKGIIRTAQEVTERRPLEFADYVKCLFEDQEIYVDQILIRSKLHNISTITQKKLALSSYDSKRVVLADKITTIPFGYRGEMFGDASTIQPSSDNL